MSVRSPISTLVSLKEPASVRRFLSFSLASMGAECARLMRRGQAFAKSTMHDFESGRLPMPDEMIDAYGTLLANFLTRKCGRVIGVTLQHNSPWRVRCVTACARCGDWVEMKTMSSRLHDKCRRSRGTNGTNNRTGKAANRQTSKKSPGGDRERSAQRGKRGNK